MCLLGGCGLQIMESVLTPTESPVTVTTAPGTPVNLTELPAYSEEAYVKINDNIPYFTEEEKTSVAFEQYGELDELGRCSAAYACISTDLMPTQDREPIGAVKPTGWHLVKYDCIADLYLYNRCHLIGYQLTGENANTKNLITGTRYMNIEGMLPFENKVANYVKKTGNHVLYRVTPIFDGDNLLCTGVQMEAWSVEDNGKGICFHVFCYNVQPGIGIDYVTGESWEIEEPEGESGNSRAEDELESNVGETEDSQENSSGFAGCTYILNTNTKKFHYPTCDSVTQMKEKNREDFFGTRGEAIDEGYSPCGNCRP